MQTVHFYSNRPVLHNLQVTLLPDREAFLHYVGTRRQDAAGAQALMLGFSPEQTRQGCSQAELIFDAGRFTPALVAHEVFHALLWAFHQAGLPLTEPAHEELFATLQGLLTESIWEWGQTDSALLGT